MLVLQAVRTKRENFRLILSLGVLFALTPFTIDLYLSAFPQIAQDINTTVSNMSLTVSLYFIGFAFGQILYGPFLDRYGRKPPLYVGLLIYSVATVGCMTAHSLNTLLIFRLMSALGGSVASVAALTMVRDFFPPKEVSRVFSLLMLVLSTSPLLAPTIGSLLVVEWGWRFLFGVLLALAVIDVGIVFSLPLGYSPDASVKLRIKPIFKTYRSIFQIAQFRMYVLVASLSFAGLFVYVAASPNVFMQGYGLSARQFGAVFAFIAGGMIIGGQLNRYFLKRMEGKKLLRNALKVQATLAFVFFLSSVTVGCGFAPTLILVFLILLCAGITSPNGSALAVAPFTKNVGSASSLFSFMELGLGALASAGLGIFKTQTTLPMAAIMAVCTVGAFLILKIYEQNLIDQ